MELAQLGKQRITYVLALRSLLYNGRPSNAAAISAARSANSHALRSQYCS
jgi:hypothetical protein